MNRKKTLTWCLAAAGVLAVGYVAVGWWRHATGIRHSVATASGIAEVPKIGPAFAGWTTSAVRYILVEGYRHDEYFVMGFTKAEDLEGFTRQDPNWFVWKESGARPKYGLDRTIQQIDPDSLGLWSPDNWMLSVDRNGCLIVMGFSPKSGRFWANVVRLHGPPT